MTDGLMLNFILLRVLLISIGQLGQTQPQKTSSDLLKATFRYMHTLYIFSQVQLIIEYIYIDKKRDPRI